MQLYEELAARGLIAQVTNEDEIREIINAGKASLLYQYTESLRIHTV